MEIENEKYNMAILNIGTAHDIINSYSHIPAIKKACFELQEALENLIKDNV